MKLFVVQLVVAQLLFILSSIVHSQSQGCQTPEGTPGQCISIVECPSLQDLLKQIQSGNGPSGGLQLLRRSICSLRPYLVCCATSTPTEPDPPVETPPNPPTPKLSLLPTQCGIRALVDRVISGEDAPLFAWPWMVLLESEDAATGRSSVICGGVLISDRYVMTAAHCIDPKIAPKLRNVRIGEHTLSDNPDCRNGQCAPPSQSILVEQTTTHESYGLPFGCRNCNDIALLRLARKVQFTSSLHVQPVCLPQNLQRDLGFSQSEFNGRTAWVAGWGTTDPRQSRIANVLQQVLLPINNDVCSNDLKVFPDQNMVLCAGGQEQDTCRGDSGGPLVMDGSESTKYYVVGIVSRGPVICGAANTGGLYTNINHYVPWILSNLQP